MFNIKHSEIYYILKKKLNQIKNNNNFLEFGIILKIFDGIVRIFGLKKAFYGEVIQFYNYEKGIVLSLEEDNIGVVLFNYFTNLKEGDIAKRTYKVISIYVGEYMMGRVINPLGLQIDGNEIFTKKKLFEMPIERKAPGVIYRQFVNEPLQTGIKFIDSMIPIGRGQRELIIGDRQTGKTSIAIDTIINQKYFYKKKKKVYCIYVAIGQKASNVAKIVSTLKKYGALSYTIIVTANASDSALMQVIAPFSGTAIGEYFRDTGRSALIIYDDLSKQAVAYREISLLLRRPIGREAYPGDIFYLHSRLLERSAKIIDDDNLAKKMNDIPKSLKGHIKGGGSLTALPIVETQEGDISSYIPTNVISITDGQIFLETELFNSGIRPAINEGISVSRVGSSAQIKSMKKVASKLKLDQANYRELEAFSKFSSEMDSITYSIIEKGKRNVEILKQSVHYTYKIEEQIIIIFAGTHNFLINIPFEKIKYFEKKCIKYFHDNHPNLLKNLRDGLFDKKINKKLNKIFLKLNKIYVKSKKN